MKKHQIIIIIMLLLAFVYFSYNNIESYLSGFFVNNKILYLNLSVVNHSMTKLSADSSNRLLLKACVRDNLNVPVENIPVEFQVVTKLGEVIALSNRTNKFGEVLAYYIPPDNVKSDEDSTDVEIRASINGTSSFSTINLGLVSVPVVFIHGYQENAHIFDNIKEYIDSNGFESYVFEYPSSNGIIPAAQMLPSFLDDLKNEYMKKGIKVESFDLITHSMGGLVARYYTAGYDFIKRNDARKIIFVSVPHKGSVWASLGAGYFDDQGVRDMIPESDLLSTILPSMLNKGLNSTVSAANLLGMNDEVVTPDSASLSKWGINTELFNLGVNSLSVENLINGGSLDAKNHKAILNNTKVFERIVELLGTELTYPQQLR